ncbi:MAG: triose-phosphate isomerase [Clostridiales bacterium]|nr:triose-phosphate isomerase [Clostridiales bacterium]
MDKIIAANWKMNNTFADIKPFVKYIKKNQKNKNNLVVCVPSVMLSEFAKQAKGVCETGAQNCYFEAKGAYTGEISASMVKSTGANYTLVGHSERRQLFGETNEMLNKKLVAALKEGLKVIFCIGEVLEEKSKYKSVLKKQIVEGFAGITDFSNIVVAYEPVWAIGTGKVATTADIKKVHAFVKQTFKENFGVDMLVLYGGSVKPSNSKEILALDEVDGVLIGGASLKAEDYIAIAQSR